MEFDHRLAVLGLIRLQRRLVSKPNQIHSWCWECSRQQSEDNAYCGSTNESPKVHFVHHALNHKPSRSGLYRLNEMTTTGLK